MTVAGDVETKRSDQLQVLSEDWTKFVALKRGEWVEMSIHGQIAASMQSLEQFLGEEIAKRITSATQTGGAV